MVRCHAAKVWGEVFSYLHAATVKLHSSMLVVCLSE
jgi:hypothetical protein